MIIDSHCHLEYEPLSFNLEKIISRANNDGVKSMLTISTTDKSLEKILKIAGVVKKMRIKFFQKKKSILNKFFSKKNQFLNIFFLKKK